MAHKKAVGYLMLFHLIARQTESDDLALIQP